MKNYLLKSSFITLLLLLTTKLYAQNIGINSDGSTPNASAGLDIKFSNKGLLLPRVTINNVNLAAPITSPAEGLLVYNETGSVTKGFYYWNGSKWVLLITNATPNPNWALTGNAGTVDGTNFIGTTDNVPINFKVNNLKAGRIGTTGDESVFLGYQAGNSDDKSNNRNVGIGYQALFSNTDGNSNTANGYFAMYSNTTGRLNTAYGYCALYSNTTGRLNIANGYCALYSNTTGDGNTANGYFALRSNTTGAGNTANGFWALYSNTTGSFNTANGYYALYSNTTGYLNTANGYQTLYSNTTGEHNTANGNNALYSNTTGISNTANGYYALYNVTTGSNNIGVGNNAQVPNPTASNQVRIGNINITYAGVQVAWTITSDSHWKTDIKETSLGLSFIKTLRPVVYVRINDEKKRPEYGFIAQEVEQNLKDAGVDPEGIITIDDEGMYGVRYNDFIAPMVKSIQELSTENEELKAKNKELEQRLERLEKLIK